MKEEEKESEAYAFQEKLLIVDDNELNRDMLRLRLEKHGYWVKGLARAQNAIDYVTENRVDLILLDILMPDMSGMEALQLLREKYSPIELPIIMATALDSNDDIVNALKLGANDYVTKPINFPVALARIHTQLDHKRLHIALRKSEERYSLAFQGANDGLWDWDLTSNKIFFSPRWKAILGFEENEIENTIETWFTRIHPAESEKVNLALKAHLARETESFEFKCRILHKDGVYRWVYIRGLAIFDQENKPLRIAGSQTDITRITIIDYVTDLPNEVLLLDRLELAMLKSNRENYSYTLLLIEAHQFKRIHENLGLQLSEALLVDLSKRFKACVQLGEKHFNSEVFLSLAHLGKARFSILLEGPAAILTFPNIIRYINKIFDTFKALFKFDAQSLSMSINIGIVLNDERYDNAKELLQKASVALSKATQAGEWQYAIFDSEMHKREIENWEFETRLVEAVERKEFVPFYQPIVSLTTGKITGFEALVRWNHPDSGIIIPAKFIPLAESTGLISQIGSMMLRNVCVQIRKWAAAGFLSSAFYVSVNLSSKQFEGSFIGDLSKILKETKVDPRQLTLELTESIIIEEGEKINDIFKQLKQLNLKLSLDDFGTGYSSLSYLHTYPLDVLKIDRSFIAQMGTSSKIFEIVKIMISLARTIGLEVVAEGVETKVQMNTLKELGCSYAQGYYFAEAMTAAQAEALLIESPQW